MNILISTSGRKGDLNKDARRLKKEGIEAEVSPWQMGANGKQLYGLWVPEEFVDKERRKVRR